MDNVRSHGQVPDSYAECMTAGIRAAEEGRRSFARRLFRRATELAPQEKDAWLWLAGLSRDPRESIRYLERVLAIDPADEAALEGMEWARKRLRPVTAAPGPEIRRPEPEARAVPERPGASRLGVRPWVWWLMAVVALLLVAGVLLGPTVYEWAVASGRPTATPTSTNLEKIARWRGPLEEAWQQGHWTAAITILERIRDLEPEYGGVTEWLTAAYTNYGRSLVSLRRWDEARAAIEKALAIQPDFAPARDQAEALEQYFLGLDRYNAGDWQGARQALQTAYRIDSAYPDLQGLLYDACVRHGSQLQDSGDLLGAKEAYEAALGVMPGGEEAQAKLAEVNYLLTPPTPTPTPVPPKKIVIDISEQRMYVYQGEHLIWKWLCSTGLPGRDTRTGTFAVQSKIEEAYSSVWRLRMPYWLGIYWAGASENGIHALPINPDGTILWSGLLGQKASFGCIILDTPNAKMLYDWAEIGTPVIIQP